MKRSIQYLAFTGMLLLISCVSLTVNVYFPAAEIKDAAEKIEDRVRSGQGAEKMQSYLENLFPARAHYGIGISLEVPDACAGEEVNINIETPTITKIIESRTKRYKVIKPEMDNGNLGENLSGYLAIRDPKAHDLKALATLKKFVQDENKDREALYLEILKENKLEATKENKEQVEKLFAQAIRKKMEVGHWYLKDKDTWEQKKKEDEKK